MSLSNKDFPLASGLLDYFPDALMAVANCSKVGNDQHNPGQPLHWAKDKSADHADALLRHLKDRGTLDTDGVRHSAKVAWRALANLQVEIEKAKEQREEPRKRGMRGPAPTKVTIYPSPTPSSVKQDCYTCAYRRVFPHTHPCADCFNARTATFQNWKPQ